jgi:hypothetical protein
MGAVNWPKMPKIPQHLSAQIVYPSPAVLDFYQKRLHWASVVRGPTFYDDHCETTRSLDRERRLKINPTVVVHTNNNK